MIVDTHVHAIAEDQRKYPRKVAPEHNEWVKDTSAETLLALMGDAGIDRTIIVQAYGAYQYDNSYAADCAVQYPGRFASVCILDPLNPAAPDQLSHLVNERGVRGLRIFTLTQPERFMLDDPTTFPLWERAALLKIAVCVCTRFSQLPRLRVPLDRFPDLKVALDHVGGPRLDEGPPYAGAQPLFDLARFPNLYLKFSSVTMYAAARGASTPQEFFRRLRDAFGARRMMWGSNFPATHDRPLKDQLQLARDHLAFASDEDRRLLFGDTALTLWPTLR
jgi:predicted TIM-barrel fold metal-dependent hydrolase